MPKIRTYKLLKQEFGVENYIRALMQKYHRSSLARMRMGVYPLHLETGRWRGLPIQDRLCKSCDMAEVEDEKHFPYVCPRHTQLRIEIHQQMNTILD